MVTLGAGNYTYEVVENWAKLPDGWGFKEVAAVGVDANDNVYAFNRGEHPMMVFDRQGNFLRSWGEGVFPRAHGDHFLRELADAVGTGRANRRILGQRGVREAVDER